MSDKVSAENDAMAAKHGIKNESAPIPADFTSESAHDIAIEEIKKRKEFGLEKYGTILHAENGRNHLNDAKQEVIDLLVYIICEEKKQENIEATSGFNILTANPKSTLLMNTDGTLTGVGEKVALLGLRMLTEACGRQQVANGWRDRDRPFTEESMLVVTELSEAVEEWRNGHELDETYFNKDKPTKPEGVPSELVDAIIRICDLSQKYGIDLGSNFLLKFKYNFTRGYRHGGKRV